MTGRGDRRHAKPGVSGCRQPIDQLWGVAPPAPITYSSYYPPGVARYVPLPVHDTFDVARGHDVTAAARFPGQGPNWAL